MKTDLFQSCDHCWVFQIFWHIKCSTLTTYLYKLMLFSYCCVWIFVIAWTVAPQLLYLRDFPGKNAGVCCDLPNPGMKSMSPSPRVLVSVSFTTELLGKLHINWYMNINIHFILIYYWCHISSCCVKWIPFFYVVLMSQVHVCLLLTW